MSFLRSPGSEGSVEAPPTLCTWPSNRLAAETVASGWDPTSGGATEPGWARWAALPSPPPQSLSPRISNLCPPLGQPPTGWSTRTSCAALGKAMSPCPREAGVPNELINVGKALGDLRLKGVQYTQIRVIVITHNYGVSAGEIIPSGRWLGQHRALPRSAPQQQWNLSSFPASLLLPPPCSCVLLSSGPAACSSTANAFFVSSSRREAPGTAGGGRGLHSSISLSGSEKGSRSRA